MLSNTKIFVFDVDGVLIDSTEECLVVAWNAHQDYMGKANYITHPMESNNEYADHFRQLRNYVRKMDEYFLVFNCSSNEINSQNEYETRLLQLNQSKMKIFGEKFFNARSRLKSKDKSKWIGLHYIYPGIRELIHVVNKKYPIYIVTGKDKNSVLYFLDYFEIEINPNNIYDKEIAKNKFLALEEISHIENVENYKITFLDDNVMHLLDAQDKGFNVLMADWGYGMAEHFALAKQRNIETISIKKLIECLKQTS